MVCPRGHSFDIARSGYVNLLQPQERRSKQPGDTPAAVSARRRLHDRGVTRTHADADFGNARRAGREISCSMPGAATAFIWARLARQIGFDAHGVDISSIAVDAAARRYPECEWIVANADRFVPYAEASFSVVMSITARMNASEFRRVLRSDGRLLVGVPAPDDLIELRGSGRDRVAGAIQTFAPSFSLVDQRRVSTQADLDAASVHDVLLSIYRPMGSRPVEGMRVTFSLDMLLFRSA